MFEDKHKVVFIDWGLFLHRAIFAWSSQRKTVAKGAFLPPAHYTCLMMVINCLKKVGVDKQDLLIVAVDGRGNWRRDVDPNYKANRKEIKQNDDIDWMYWYKKFDDLVDKLKVSSPLNFIRIPKLEADDIISVGVRYYSENECIIISSDSDFEQLTSLPNVKVFSPVTKQYKSVDNPYKVLASKIKKEVTDNLLSPILDEADYTRRHMLVSLLELPDYVEKLALDEIKKVGYNKFDPALFPFKNMNEQFQKIYNKDQIVLYEDSMKIKVKKKSKSKKKKGDENVQSSSKIQGW